MTLGGRLSIGLALIWAAAWSVFLVDGLPVPCAELCRLALLTLSFPVALLKFNSMGLYSLSDFLFYCALLVPNIFLLGYGLAGIWRFLLWFNGGPIAGDDPVNEVKPVPSIESRRDAGI
ncbi:hypothetical protein HAHE_14400 [Haloferula helveola]|uniref:Uncharacterized protein n=1 Tax=Haloferula helveola TaxID=490095 RepID=A0ABN6H1P2_9BACT|nr:hypothetical protein HAHE_14400 [Haloferula helveola]